MSWIPRLPEEVWVGLWLFWYVGLVLGVFVLLEAWALATGGVTFTGTVSWLRSHHIAVLAGLGALTVALTGWLLWHFFLEPEFAPGLRRTWIDDGIIAAVLFIGSWLIARSRRKGRQDSPGESP